MKNLILKNHKILLFLLISLFLLSFNQVKGGEFVVINKTYTYSATATAFDCHTHPDGTMPTNWKSPDDYWNGKFYGYFELIDIPSNEVVGFQMGIYQYMPVRDGKNYYETCSLVQAKLQGEGAVLKVEYGSPAAWWQHPNGPVDFSKVYDFESVGLVIWSHMAGHTGIISPTAWGGDDIANEVRAYFMPCTIRVIIVAVSAGSTFSGWGNYTGGGCTPVQQPTPTYGIDNVNGTTNKVVPSTDEYAYSPDMSGALNGTGQKLALTPGQTVYFRTKKVNDCLLASNIQTLVVPAGCTPAQQATPTYGIDYTSERTNKIVPSTDEYSIHSDMSGAVSGTGQKLTLTPGQTIYFRTKKASDCLLASNIQTLVMPSRPAVPSVSVDFINERTTENIGSTIEYSSSSSYTNPVTGSGNKIQLTPGQDLYFWVKATASSFYSLVTHLTVPNRPVTPAITIDFANEKTSVVPATMEWSTSLSMTSATMGTSAQITVTPGTDLYFRVKSTASSFASAIQSLNVPDRPAVPSVTIDYASEKTFENIGSTIDYSASSSYTSPITGTGNKIELTPGQDLYFWVKATASSFYSLVTHLTVPNRPAAPAITIDFVNERTSAVAATMEWSTSQSMTSAASGTSAPVVVTPGTDMYFRVKSTASSFTSAIQSLNVPDRPSVPSVSINYFNETTAENIGSTMEWSTNLLMTSASTGTGNPLTVSPGTDLYFRTKSTLSTFASGIQSLDVKERPAVPNYQIDYFTEKTIQIVPVSDEYSTSSDMSGANSGLGASINILPGSDLYFRTKATASNFRSDIQHLNIDVRPEPTLFTINYENETTTEPVNSSIEYDSVSTFSAPSAGDGNVLLLIPGKHMFFRIKANESSFNSLAYELNVPSRPILEYNGKDTIFSASFPIRAIIGTSVTDFDLSDITVNNGVALNLLSDNNFEIIAEDTGEVKVKIPVNAFAGGSFASNEIAVYYKKILSGIAQISNENFRIWPNPCADKTLFIEAISGIPYSFGILTIDGRLIKNVVQKTTGITPIDVQDLPKGIYLLKIDQGLNNELFKFIIE